MSRDRVKSEVIANCFKKCGFFGAQDDVFSIEEDDGGLQIPDWDHLNVDVSPEEFVTADDHLATCELHTLRDIIAEATSATVEDDDDDEDDDTRGLGDYCGDCCAVPRSRTHVKDGDVQLPGGQVNCMPRGVRRLRCTMGHTKARVPDLPADS